MLIVYPQAIKAKYNKGRNQIWLFIQMKSKSSTMWRMNGITLKRYLVLSIVPRHMQERLDTIREIFNGETNFADNKKLKRKFA